MPLYDTAFRTVLFAVLKKIKNFEIFLPKKKYFSKSLRILLYEAVKTPKKQRRSVSYE